MEDLEPLFPFPGETRNAIVCDFRIISRGGLFLAMPLQPRAATATLELYPAQRPAARLFKRGLQLILRWDLPVPVATGRHVFARDDPFTEFLSGLVPSLFESGDLGIFARSRMAHRRRYLLLLCERGEPRFVIKAGTGAAARAMIKHEALFLQRVSAPGIERPVASFEGERSSAFAMTVAHGDPPYDVQPDTLARLLASWIRKTEPPIALRKLTSWSKLASACSNDSLWQRVNAKTAECQVRPVIAHGDFVPWNIRVDSRNSQWRFLDWQTGEERGIPTWDWLHFVIQRALLVTRSSPSEIATRIESLMRTRAFADYLEQARCSTIAYELVLSYLLYRLHVPNEFSNQPTDPSQLENVAEDDRHSGVERQTEGTLQFLLQHLTKE